MEAAGKPSSWTQVYVKGWLANRSSRTDAGERRLVEAAGVERERGAIMN